jgi:ubiquinone/menaquinone biosynthesis C-methylase UbiE
MGNNEYIQANRAAWNQAAPIHAEHNLEKLLHDFKIPGFTCLDDIKKGIPDEIGLAGKDVAQMCCNNGRELLSLRNMGAGRCVGFDLADAFIEQGRSLASSAGIDCEFVCSSVNEIPRGYDGGFDLVYITVGALGWMPDLNDLFAVVKRLLRPGGWLLIYEMHPMLDMFDAEAEDSFPLRHSYFKSEPYAEEGGLDYYGNKEYHSLMSYWFHHKMSDIIQGCLNNRLQLVSFQEYDHDVSSVFKGMEKQAVRPPLSYTLVVRYLE